MTINRKAQYAHIYARFIREKLISLDIRKKKLIEDKDGVSLKSINEEQNSLLGLYNHYSKMSLEKRRKVIKTITY